MKNLMFADATFAELIRDLFGNVKVLAREQYALARQEMSETVSCYGRNALFLVIGGFIAYAGLIVLMGSIGLLAGFGFQKLGMARLLAAFVGVGVVGMLVVLSGLVFVLKGRHAMATGSVAPRKTIATIKHLKNSNETKVRQPGQSRLLQLPKRSADEIQNRVLKMEDRLNLELKEIAYRATPAGMKDRTVEHMQAHPYAWAATALVGGIVGTMLVVRKVRKRKWARDIYRLRGLLHPA